MQDRIPFSQLVLKQITASDVNLKRFYLPDVPNIRYKHIIGVEVMNVSQVPKTPFGADVINATAFSNSYLTIVDVNKVERLYQEPFYSLSRENNNGNYIPLDLWIDCQKTYIDYGATGVALVAGETYMIVFYYDDKIKPAGEV